MLQLLNAMNLWKYPILNPNAMYLDWGCWTPLGNGCWVKLDGAVGTGYFLIDLPENFSSLCSILSQIHRLYGLKSFTLKIGHTKIHVI